MLACRVPGQVDSGVVVGITHETFDNTAAGYGAAADLRAHKRHLANRVIHRMWRDETTRQQPHTLDA